MSDTPVLDGVAPMQLTGFQQTESSPLSLHLQRAASALDSACRLDKTVERNVAGDKPFGPALVHATSISRTRMDRPERG
jgi:hypothetical protein